MYQFDEILVLYEKNKQLYVEEEEDVHNNSTAPFEEEEEEYSNSSDDDDDDEWALHKAASSSILDCYSEEEDDDEDDEDGIDTDCNNDWSSEESSATILHCHSEEEEEVESSDDDDAEIHTDSDDEWYSSRQLLLSEESENKEKEEGEEHTSIIANNNNNNEEEKVWALDPTTPMLKIPATPQLKVNNSDKEEGGKSSDYEVQSKRSSDDDEIRTDSGDEWYSPRQLLLDDIENEEEGKKHNTNANTEEKAWTLDPTTPLLKIPDTPVLKNIDSRKDKEVGGKSSNYEVHSERSSDDGIHVDSGDEWYSPRQLLLDEIENEEGGKEHNINANTEEKVWALDPTTPLLKIPATPQLNVNSSQKDKEEGSKSIKEEGKEYNTNANNREKMWALDPATPLLKIPDTPLLKNFNSRKGKEKGGRRGNYEVQSESSSDNEIHTDSGDEWFSSRQLLFDETENKEAEKESNTKAKNKEKVWGLDPTTPLLKIPATPQLEINNSGKDKEEVGESSDDEVQSERSIDDEIHADSGDEWFSSRQLLDETENEEAGKVYNSIANKEKEVWALDPATPLLKIPDTPLLKRNPDCCDEDLLIEAENNDEWASEATPLLIHDTFIDEEEQQHHSDDESSSKNSSKQLIMSDFQSKEKDDDNNEDETEQHIVASNDEWDSESEPLLIPD